MKVKISRFIKNPSIHDRLNEIPSRLQTHSHKIFFSKHANAVNGEFLRHKGTWLIKMQIRLWYCERGWAKKSHALYANYSAMHRTLAKSSDVPLDFVKDRCRGVNLIARNSPYNELDIMSSARQNWSSIDFPSLPPSFRNKVSLIIYLAPSF